MFEANNVEGEQHQKTVRDQNESQSKREDSTESDYYYDDSTGYEVYREDEDEPAAEPEADQSDDRPADV
jgi:hypothetical protein